MLIDEPCACGRTNRRMARLRGRHDDMLIIRGVNVYPSEVEAVLLALDEIAPFYQLILAKEGPLDTLEIQAEVTEEILHRLPTGHPRSVGRPAASIPTTRASAPSTTASPTNSAPASASAPPSPSWPPTPSPASKSARRCG